MRLTKYLIFFFIFFASACSVTKKCQFKDYSYIKVIKVIDGDTVLLSNKKILRYIGIDTPEITRKTEKGFIYQPQPFAIEAKEYNKKLVEGKYIRVEFDIEKIDKYGRLLGYCFVDDIFVNAKLLEDGFAAVYTKPPNLKYKDLFLKLQKDAREKRKGLWGAYETIEHTQAYKYIGQIRTVQGKVLSTYKSKKCLFLNFGNDYKTDFTITIFNDALENFYRQNIDPANFYLGKVVQVTGRLRHYNGPEIIIYTPADIEIIDEK
ncbi:MAG: thermonuclease family protein [Candidatus Omnitrophica bacterium]|nr:thermonuclease family protein [Candidatus Omnitrophota bacterium]